MTQWEPILVSMVLVPWAIGASAASLTGHLELSARDVSVSGDVAKYDQHIDLDDGVRLSSLAISFRPDSGQRRLPDVVDIRASGLGGEPFESIGVEIREFGAYRFRYDRQRSDYFYQDLLLLPENASVEGSTGGDFHHFDFERVRDHVRLDWQLSDRARLDLDFQRHEKTGDSTTVYDVEREEFELERPIDELSQTYGASLTYAWDTVTVVWTERFREYDSASSVLLPGFSEGSDPLEPTQLDFFFFDQPYGFDTLEHQLRVTGHPTERLRFSVHGLLTDLDLDMRVDERAQGVDFTGTPFATDVAGTGEIDLQTQMFELAGSYLVSERVQLLASVRRSELDQDGSLLFGESVGASDWRIETDAVEVGAEIVLLDTLTLAAGWSFERRDSEFLQESEDFIDEEDVETERDGYYVDLAYRPLPNAKLSVSFNDASTDDPFTLASATDSQRVRVRAHYRWDVGIGLSASYRRTTKDNHRSGWDSAVSDTNLRVDYAGKQWQLTLGASWVDADREIEQIVVGGFRQDLFAIDYSAETSNVDATVSWRQSDRLRFGASFRAYDNDGRFEAKRDDLRAHAAYRLPNEYELSLGYRRVDFDEDGIEAFDADIWELKLRYGW